jgi:hypothetical protein
LSKYGLFRGYNRVFGGKNEDIEILNEDDWLWQVPKGIDQSQVVRGQHVQGIAQPGA